MKNKGTLLDGIHLDQEFKEARERKKPPIKPISEMAKRGYDAIKNSIKSSKLFFLFIGITALCIFSGDAPFKICSLIVL